MGYDQVAYLDIPDQGEVSAFITDNNLNPNDWKAMTRIGAEFGNRGLPPGRDLGWYYTFNESCDMHEIRCSHQSNYIRDDDRFANRRFQAMLCKRLGKEDDAFPYCLTHICHGLKTRKDAIEIAQALGEFFADDRDLMYFAEWLRDTATCCSTYELSY